MQPVESAAAELARRLRDLRESHWPALNLTQAELADALAGSGSLSVPSISSWENPDNPALPPVPRLRAYATFFATARSVERTPYRLVNISELTPSEKAMREQLLEDLTALRRAAKSAKSGGVATAPGYVGGGLLRFPPGENIVIVCGPIKAELREKMPDPDPIDADHVDLYDYSDLDPLLELYGRLSALNPDSSIRWVRSDKLTARNYTDHLVVIGGVDWNDAVRDLAHRTDVPVRQLARGTKEDLGGFEVGGSPSTDTIQTFVPQPLEAGEPSHLAEDVAQIYRGPSPYYQKRIVMQFNGQFARGTLGAVRALTDPRFRDQNEAYLRERFAGEKEWCLLTKVVIADGKPIPPAWTIADNRLYEWPARPGSRG